MKGRTSIPLALLVTGAWATVIGPIGDLIIANRDIAPDGFNRSYVSFLCFFLFPAL